MSKQETATEKRIREEIGNISRSDVLAAIRSIKDHGICHRSKIQRYARCSQIKATLLICYLDVVGIIGNLNTKTGEYEIIVDIEDLSDE